MYVGDAPILKAMEQSPLDIEPQVDSYNPSTASFRIVCAVGIEAYTHPLKRTRGTMIPDQWLRGR